MAFSKDIPARPSDPRRDSTDAAVLGAAGTMAAAQYEPAGFKATMNAENSRIAADPAIQSQLVPMKVQGAGGDPGVTSRMAPDGGGLNAGVAPDGGGETVQAASQDTYRQVHGGFQPGVDSYEKVSDGGVDRSMSTSERRAAPPDQTASSTDNPHLQLRVEMQI